MFARVNSRETHALNEKKTVEEKRGEREWGDVIAPNRAHRENEREREKVCNWTSNEPLRVSSRR